MQETPSPIESARFCITYSPLSGEPRTLELGKEEFPIAPDPETDPNLTAKEAIRAAGTRPTVIYLPGTRFDLTGTRHGRGGGWYDRFLSAVPSEWLRVGVCLPSQLSETPLLRQPWDQPVDYVCVVRDRGVEWVRTGARD